MIEIKCFKCKECLDLSTCDNPTKKTPITDCFCHRGNWDGSDFIGEDLRNWEWNDCDDFDFKISSYKTKKFFKDIPNYELQDFLNSPAFGSETETK